MVVSSKLYPLGPFLSNPIPIRHPGSLTYRFLGRPLLWGLSKVNPFGTSGETVEKEEALWRRHNGKEYVHLPLLEVRPPPHFPIRLLLLPSLFVLSMRKVG